MSEPKNDGGPAFPGEPGETLEGTWNQLWSPGMSLRDWFAGMAMQGILARSVEYTFPGCAKAAYEQADAMLKAMEQ